MFSPNRFSVLDGVGEFGELMSQPKRKKTEYLRTKRLGFNAVQTSGATNIVQERYLVVKHQNENLNLSAISPFGIQKALDMAAPNGIMKVTRSRKGELLILTRTRIAATALLNLKNLGGLAPVVVTEHPFLNYSKGIIFCRDLVSLEEEEIKVGFSAQGVIEVRKIKKWENGELKDTAAIVLTFDTPSLPETIYAGFIKLSVRIYIPNPMKCTTCQKYGHTKKRCHSAPVCFKCATVIETPHETPCIVLKCVNCNGPHSSVSKECPAYKRENEIAKIRTTERLTYFEARTKYYRNNANTTPSAGSYASIVKERFVNENKSEKTDQQTRKPENTSIETTVQQQRNQLQLKELSQIQQQTKQQQQQQQQQIQQQIQLQQQNEQNTQQCQRQPAQQQQQKQQFVSWSNLNNTSMDVEQLMSTSKSRPCLSEAELALFNN